MNKIRLAFILLIVLTVFLNVFKKSEIPGCLNSDEMAFGYNAYSILKTGSDEHGNLMPMRLRSFDDFKMPLYSYLSIPAIALFGMNDFSIRLLNVFVAVGLLISSYALFKKVAGDQKIALLASFFVTTSMWTLIGTRHAHEVALATLLITISSYFAIDFFEKKTIKLLLITLSFALFGAFSYHIGRIYLVFIIGSIIYSLIKNGLRSKSVFTGILVSFSVFFIPFIFDLRYGVDRLSNLAFYNNIGFIARINEYIGEHNFRSIHNKLIEGIVFFTNNYLKQISADFLVVAGDANNKFGFVEMSPITIVMYICAIIGLLALFESKNKYRYFIAGLLFVSPIGNALTWQPYSLTRTFFLIVPLAFMASIGVFRLSMGIGDQIECYVGKLGRNLVTPLLLAIHLFFLLFSYDIYFNHYFKRTSVQTAWQCGYKEMAKYIRDNYDKYDHFYITKKNGQPYMALLFYNQIDPEIFRGQVVRSKSDQYGFTQVEKFDKFIFTVPTQKGQPRSSYIGFPDEINEDQVTSRIKHKGREIFRVKENK